MQILNISVQNEPKFTFKSSVIFPVESGSSKITAASSVVSFKLIDTLLTGGYCRYHNSKCFCDFT